MLNPSNAQANKAKRDLRFTAKYLQKEIFRIVAASVTGGKVTKVTGLLGRAPLHGRAGRQRMAKQIPRCARDDNSYRDDNS
jgi:hypothetical protein